MLPLHLQGKKRGSSGEPSPRHIRQVSASSLGLLDVVESMMATVGASESSIVKIVGGRVMR